MKDEVRDRGRQDAGEEDRQPFIPHPSSLDDDRRASDALARALDEDDWRRLRRCGCWHCQARARELERALFGRLLNERAPAEPCIC